MKLNCKVAIYEQSRLKCANEDNSKHNAFKLIMGIKLIVAV